MNDNDRQDKPTSAQFDHAVKVYQAMHARATTEVFTDDEGEENSHKVYTGHLTRLFQELLLAVPYYTSVMNTLKRMGCVEQLRRGGGNAPSKWVLYSEPKEEAFNDLKPRARKSASKLDALEQRINDQNKRILTLEKTVGVIGA
jgi:hypothetical protein